MFSFWKKYTIKKGNHFSGLRIAPIIILPNKTITKEVFFDKNCYLYQNSCINKLFGFSLRLLPKIDKGKIYLPHHWLSFRIGWEQCVFSNNIIFLHAYYYDGGIRKSNLIGFMEQKNGSKKITVSKIGNEISVFVADKFVSRITLENLKGNKTVLGYKLFPFFGGKDVTDKTINVCLKNL